MIERSAASADPEIASAAQRRVFHSKVDTIRPTYGFEDVSLAPGTDTIEPADVDLSQVFCGIDLAIPILASAMDAVVDVRMAGALAGARRPGDPEPRRASRRATTSRTRSSGGSPTRRTATSSRCSPRPTRRRSARTSSPAGSTRSTPPGRGPRSPRRPAPPAGSGRSAPSTARTCSSSRARSRRPAISPPSTTRCRSRRSPATCRSRSRSATRPTPRRPSR